MRAILVELLTTGGTIITCGVGVFFTSLLARNALLEIYGDGMLPLAAQWATTSFRWTPVLFSATLLLLVYFRIRHPSKLWITWAALCLTALITAFVAVGVVLPFARTTFNLG